jgi:hypothetical protein
LLKFWYPKGYGEEYGMDNEKKVSKETKKPEYVSPEAKFFGFEFAKQAVDASNGDSSDDGSEDEL